MMNRLLCIILIALYNTLAYGQTCCSAGAPINAAFGIINNGNNQLILNLDYTFVNVNRLVSDSEILQNDPRNRSGQYILLKAGYSISDRWSISSIIPYISQSRNTFSQSESNHGIGDISILGQYEIIPQKLSFGAGIQLPSGNTKGTNSSGLISSPDMQSGSGTWDFIATIQWTENHFLIPNLQQNFSFAAKYNGTNNNFGDPQGVLGRQFKFGDEYSSKINWSYLLLLGDWFVIPNIGLNYNYNTRNKEQGTDASNSGGHWINLPLGIQFQPEEKFIFGAKAMLPIIQKLNGLQITTKFSFGFSITYLL